MPCFWGSNPNLGTRGATIINKAVPGSNQMCCALLNRIINMYYFEMPFITLVDRGSFPRSEGAPRSVGKPRCTSSLLTAARRFMMEIRGNRPVSPNRSFTIVLKQLVFLQLVGSIFRRYSALFSFGIMKTIVSRTLVFFLNCFKIP